MDGSNNFLLRDTARIAVKPNWAVDATTPSFTAMPWLLSVDLNDPEVQADLRRQMALAQNSPDDVLFQKETEDENEHMLKELGL